MAKVYPVATKSEMLGDPTSQPIDISFYRSLKDPVGDRVEVQEECIEGKGCSISTVDLGWASDGKACNSSPITTLLDFVAVAYADEQTSGGVQRGWRVPSLETLDNQKNRDSVGYTKFVIKSDPLPRLGQADSFTYYIKVNGTPIYVDGSRPDDMIQPFNASDGLTFAFGLENLNFSGADQGCENISVLFEFRKQNQVIQRAGVTRRYAALRDAEREAVQSQEGISFTWSGNYVKPQKEDRFEAFIVSTPDVNEATRIKGRLDKAGLRFHEMQVVGVVRPPLDRNAYAVVVGLLQPTGQVRFTFDKKVGYELLSWVKEESQQPKLASIIHRTVFLYEMRPGESGVGAYKACGDDTLARLRR